MHTQQTGHEIHERLLLATSAPGTERTESQVIKSAMSEEKTMH